MLKSRLKTLREQAARRYGWQLYTHRVLMQRRLWDLRTRQSDVRTALSEGALYTGLIPPAMENDAFLSRPDINRSSWYMDVFTHSTEEYVYRIRRPVTIEPKYGYAVLKPHSLLDVSVPRSESTRDPGKMLDFSGLPSFREFRDREKNGSPIIRVPSVISLRYSHEENYYHVLQDILSRLKMFDDCGVDRKTPIVISRAMAETSFFRQMRLCGDLAKRNWLVQDRSYIDADEIYLARTAEGNRDRLQYLARLLDSPPPNPNSARRIFIFRDGRKYGRGILNMDELQPVLARFEYEIVDPQSLAFPEQMRLFSEARVVIGAHGAGLTNIIFRGDAPLTLLELFPPGETPLHFYIIARAFGFDYRYLMGRAEVGEGRTVSFHIDAGGLETRLAEIDKTL